MIKALPKQLRRNLEPVPEHVTKFLGWLDAAKAVTGQLSAASLKQSLGQFVLRTTGSPLPADVWQHEAPLPHLLMNFRVVDDAGHEMASGRDLPKLRRELGQAAQLTFSASEPGNATRTPLPQVSGYRHSARS